MLKSILYDYSEINKLVKEGISITRAGVDETVRAADRKMQQVRFKTCDFIRRNRYSINTFE